jgi:hypothetical protein
MGGWTRRGCFLCVTVTALASSGVLLPQLAQASTSSGGGAPLLAASKSAVTHENSVHVMSTASSDQLGATPNVQGSVTITTDAARNDGIQHVTFQQGATSGEETVEEVGGVGYFSGDAFTLENFNGFSSSAAERYTGTWLKVTKSDTAFSKVTSGLTMSSIPAQMVLPEPHLVPGSSTIDGYQVKCLQAVFHESTGMVTGRMYLRARGKPLPVEQTYTQKNGSVGTDVFSGWNETVTVVPPSSSVPFSSTGQ